MERLPIHTGRIQRRRHGELPVRLVEILLIFVSAEIVRWVAENARPFNIVKDRAFLSLMKTGRPSHYIPSPSTVSRDVKLVFARTRQRIAKMLREYEGRISFATDSWTSPNHKPYVAVTSHHEEKGMPVCLLLDIVEVAKSHSGANLAAAFIQILKEFGIDDKVRGEKNINNARINTRAYQILCTTCDNATSNDTMIEEMDFELDAFSQVNHVRCFLHIVNLVAKALIKMFDTTKRGTQSDDEELMELSAGIEDEEAETRALGNGVTDDDVEDDDISDNEVEEVLGLTAAERERLNVELRPVKLLLVKVSVLRFEEMGGRSPCTWSSCEN